MRKVGLLGTSALRSVALLGLALSVSSPALAQDPPAEEGAGETQEEPAAGPVDITTAAQQAESGDPPIVVTGSRIRSVTPFNSPDPVAVIDPEIAAREGRFDLASTLQSSPIAAGSTQITSAISSNFVTAGGPGAQTIDLRGLGPNRTLVLLNGRRAGPAGTRGAVSSFDLNVLPQSIAQNVQILKTGASSVYGSDAIAGVVNIITKRDTNGLEINANTSVPFQNGGEEYRINAIYGKTFSRGHFLIAADYSHTNELARGDRKYLACPEAYTFKPDGGRADLIDPRTGQYKCEDLRWGHVWTYNLVDNLQLDGPGGPNTGQNTSPESLGFPSVLLQYQYPGETLGIPAFGPPAYHGDFGAPPGWVPTGYNTASLAVQNAYHPFVDEQTIIPETDLYTVYAEGAFDVTDSIQLFGEFLANRRETYQNGWRQFWSFGWTGDIYGTGGMYNYWGQGFTGINLISPTSITNQSDTSQQVDYRRGVAGLRGNFGGASNWRWEAYGQYSKSIGRYRTQHILQDAYETSVFQYESCVGTVTPISGRQCVDVRWADPFFLRGELTPQELGFLFDWEEGKTVYTQKSGEATISGEPIRLPAGAVGLALGVSAREDKINDTPGEITLAGNAWGYSTSGITAGKSLTTEAFGELNIPLLRDTPFFQELTLSGAARLTNVKATRASDGETHEDNGNWTYKIGVNWAVTDFLRFRGSYGTSFRAPALFEQFLANESSSPSQADIDPCVQWAANLNQGLISQTTANNCQAAGIPPNHSGVGVTAEAFAQGGLGVLEAETSTALVVGAILSPRFGFMPDTTINLAVDYFDIEVNGEISQLGAKNIIYGCYGSQNFPDDPLCDLFTRGQTAAPFNINQVFDKFINIASQRNSGFDVNFSVRHDMGALGRVNFTADATYQTRDKFQLLSTSPIESDNGEAGSPKWVADLRLSWTMPEDWTLFYGVNIIGPTSDQEDWTESNQSPSAPQGCIVSSIRGTYCPDLTASTVFYHNASITKEVGERFRFTIGLSNIFDRRPPRVSVLNAGEISMMGPVVAASQYPFVGRRAFVNVTSKF